MGLLAPPATKKAPVKHWPWEGRVQEVFANLLVSHGWHLESVSDTATKEPGIDVLATNEGRLLGAEVKGFPSRGYEDPAKAGQKKPTNPNGQAKTWYAKGVLAALLLRRVEPHRESLLVLPDCARYRELASDTRSALAAAGIHLVLVREDGTYDCPTWKAG